MGLEEFMALSRFDRMVILESVNERISEHNSTLD